MEKGTSSTPVGAKCEISVVDDDGSVKLCYLKGMTNAVFERAIGLMYPSSGNPEYLRAGETIIRGLWVGGDQEILNKEDLLRSASLKAFELFSLKEASIKKL